MILSSLPCCGLRFRLMRLALGKTAREMADLLGITGNVYRAWEYRKENQVRPSSEILRLCAEYGIEKYWLLQGIGKVQDQKLILEYINNIAFSDVSERILFLRELYGISAKELIVHTGISSYYMLRQLQAHKRLYDREFILSFLKLLPDPFSYDVIADGKTEFVDRIMEICNE